VAGNTVATYAVTAVLSKYFLQVAYNLRSNTVKFLIPLIFHT